MKTILVCYEERPMTQRVVARSAELAKALGARVVVTSVAPVLGFAARGVGPYDPTDPPARHDQELEDAAARLRELGLADVETVTGLGEPARTILDLADERDVDLIVLGAHDGGLLSRILGGSVSDEVAHKANTDVLIVH
ncbi:MAG: universal stress protein [Thermoleophilia bacterium]|nr:universal stress protein [Thermoleophilia bacterium]MDH4345819.1 universal stress protein [Thermoleophilia bacterium]